MLGGENRQKGIKDTKLAAFLKSFILYFSANDFFLLNYIQLLKTFIIKMQIQ